METDTHTRTHKRVHRHTCTHKSECWLVLLNLTWAQMKRFCMCVEKSSITQQAENPHMYSLLSPILNCLLSCVHLSPLCKMSHPENVLLNHLKFDPSWDLCCMFPHTLFSFPTFPVCCLLSFFPIKIYIKKNYSKPCETLHKCRTAYKYKTLTTMI